MLTGVVALCTGCEIQDLEQVKGMSLQCMCRSGQQIPAGFDRKRSFYEMIILWFDRLSALSACIEQGVESSNESFPAKTDCEQHFEALTWLSSCQQSIKIVGKNSCRWEEEKLTSASTARCAYLIVVDPCLPRIQDWCRQSSPSIYETQSIVKVQMDNTINNWTGTEQCLRFHHGRKRCLWKCQARIFVNMDHSYPSS